MPHFKGSRKGLGCINVLAEELEGAGLWGLSFINRSTLYYKKNLACILISCLHKVRFCFYIHFMTGQEMDVGIGKLTLSSFLHLLFHHGASHLLGQQLKARANKHLGNRHEH